VIIPLMDGVAEMKIQIGTYDATMGRTGGGVFNTLLRPAATLSRDLFGYYRTTDFVANSFSTTQPGCSIAYLMEELRRRRRRPITSPRCNNGRNKTLFYVASRPIGREHQ